MGIGCIDAFAWSDTSHVHAVTVNVLMQPDTEA